MALTFHFAAFEQRYRVEDSRFRLMPPRARSDYNWIMVRHHCIAPSCRHLSFSLGATG
jgi:hypothetical protein